MTRLGRRRRVRRDFGDDSVVRTRKYSYSFCSRKGLFKVQSQSRGPAPRDRGSTGQGPCRPTSRGTRRGTPLGRRRATLRAATRATRPAPPPPFPFPATRAQAPCSSSSSRSSSSRLSSSRASSSWTAAIQPCPSCSATSFRESSASSPPAGGGGTRRIRTMVNRPTESTFHISHTSTHTNTFTHRQTVQYSPVLATLESD